MNKISRACIFLSLAYSAGFLIFLAFPDPYTPLFAKIPALIAMFAVLSAPTFIFYICLLRRRASPLGHSDLVVLIAAVLFPLSWVVCTPMITSNTKADALGILVAFVVTITHAVVLCFAAILVDVIKRRAEQTAT